MLVDLAHANVQTAEAALKVTTRPVIISHTGLDTQLGRNPNMAGMMRPRLIGKEQAKTVANAGGAVVSGRIWPTRRSNTRRISGLWWM